MQLSSACETRMFFGKSGKAVVEAGNTAKSELRSAFGCGGGRREGYPSVSFADSSPHKGSLGALPRRCGNGTLRLKTRRGLFAPSQSKIKDFCQLSHRESQGRCRARGRLWVRGWTGGFCAASQRHLIRHGVRRATFPSRGRQGALPRQREALGARVDGRFLRCFAATPHPSRRSPCHLPLKGKARGAAAPEGGYGGVKREGGKAGVLQTAAAAACKRATAP